MSAKKPAVSTGKPTVSTDGSIIIVHIPLTFRRRGGRKLVMLPNGANPAPSANPTPDLTILKALARANRWRKLLEAGKFATMTFLAESEGINHSYISRLLRLTCLAPDIIDASLKGRLPKGLGLAELMGDLPIEWDRQREALGFPAIRHAGKVDA